MAVEVGALRQRVQRYFERDIWRRPSAAESRPAAFARSALQVLVIVALGLERDLILLRATALTYFAMLSLVPILALAIGLVGAFGASEDVARAVIDRVAAGSPQAGTYILDLVKRVNFSSFGAVGGASLFVTTVLAIGNVEKAFNTIWGIERQRSDGSTSRRLPRRVGGGAAALHRRGVAGDEPSQRRVRRADSRASRCSRRPTSSVSGRCRRCCCCWASRSSTGSCRTPACVRCRRCSVAWSPPCSSGSRRRSTSASTSGVARSNAIFGSFAALPLLLVWLYVSWIVVLLGCEVAFAAQNLHSFRLARVGEEPRPAAARGDRDRGRGPRGACVPRWRGHRRRGARGSARRSGAQRARDPRRSRSRRHRLGSRLRGPRPLPARPRGRIDLDRAGARSAARRRGVRGAFPVERRADSRRGCRSGAGRGASARHAHARRSVRRAAHDRAASARLPRIHRAASAPASCSPCASTSITTPPRPCATRSRPRCCACSATSRAIRAVSHAEGAAARAEVERARERVAALVGAEPGEVVFTSGATESNNLALHGVARADCEAPSGDERGRASVRRGAARRARSRRFPGDARPRSTPDGLVDPDAVAAALTPETALVSILWANNETGVVQPIARIAERVRTRGVPLHVDATQAVGKIPCDSMRFPRICSPPRRTSSTDRRAAASWSCGASERSRPGSAADRRSAGRRGGTHNVAGIAGLGVAAELARARTRRARCALRDAARPALVRHRSEGAARAPQRRPARGASEHAVRGVPRVPPATCCSRRSTARASRSRPAQPARPARCIPRARSSRWDARPPRRAPRCASRSGTASTRRRSIACSALLPDLVARVRALAGQRRERARRRRDVGRRRFVGRRRAAGRAGLRRDRRDAAPGRRRVALLFARRRRGRAPRRGAPRHPLLRRGLQRRLPPRGDGAVRRLVSRRPHADPLRRLQPALQVPPPAGARARARCRRGRDRPLRAHRARCDERRALAAARRATRARTSPTSSSTCGRSSWRGSASRSARWTRTPCARVPANSASATADKPESQELCFVPDGDTAAAVERLRPGPRARRRRDRRRAGPRARPP